MDFTTSRSLTCWCRAQVFSHSENACPALRADQVHAARVQPSHGTRISSESVERSYQYIKALKPACSEDSSHGIAEANVDAKGSGTSTRVLSNTVGTPPSAPSPSASSATPTRAADPQLCCRGVRLQLQARVLRAQKRFLRWGLYFSRSRHSQVDTAPLGHLEQGSNHKLERSTTDQPARTRATGWIARTSR